MIEAVAFYAAAFLFEKRIKAFVINAIIIRALPDWKEKRVKIFPAKDRTPPQSTAAATRFLYVRKPRRPAIVGTMKAPEKKEKAKRRA